MPRPSIALWHAALLCAAAEVKRLREALVDAVTYAANQAGVSYAEVLDEPKFDKAREALQGGR